MKIRFNSFLQNRLTLAATFTFGLLASSSVQAAFTWDGGNGSSQLWSTGTNWTAPETAPANSFSDTFAFGGTTNVGTNLAPLNNDLTGGTATAVTFTLGAGAFVIGGNAITLGGNVTNNETTNIQTMRMNMDLGAADRTITVATGGKLVLSGALSRGTGSNTAINTAGGGTVALTGTWSDTDVGIRVGGGSKLDLTGATITGRTLSIGSGEVIVGTGSSLVFSNQNASFGVNNSTESSLYTQTGGNMTFGQLTIANGAGTNTTMNISAGTLTATTLLTSRGPTDVAANDSTTAAALINVSGTGLINTGTFTFGDGANNRYGYNTITIGTGAGSTAEFRATTAFNWGNNGSIVRNNTVEVNGGLFSTMATSVSNGASNAVLNIGNGGRLQARNASTAFLGGLDTFNIKNGGAVIDTQANDITITNSILNFSAATTASLTKSGAGTLTLSGANSYGGGTLISAGTLALSGSGTLGATTGALTFSGTGTALNLGSTTQTVASITAGTTAANMSANITGVGGTLNVSGTVVSQGLNSNFGAYGSNPTLDVNTGMVVTGATLIGRSNLAISGGTYSTSRFTSNAAGSADWGRLVISGTAAVTATNGVNGNYGTTGSNGTTATFQLELNGGTLSTPLIRVANRDFNAAGPDSNNDANLIWNGGVVKATGADNANFVQVYGDGGNGARPNQATYVSSGGAKIDTNGLNIGIQVKLLENPFSTGGGLTLNDTAATKGTLTLTGNSTYTGATLVSAGTLLVNGQLGNTAVTVDALATVGGTGSLGGSLAFAGSSNLRVVDFNDPLAVTGTVTFGSGFGIDNLLGINWDSLDLHTAYTVLSTTQIFGTGDIANFGYDNRVAVGSLGREAYFQNGSLQVVVIPEPSAALLGGLGVLTLLRRRRD